jgi:Domain of unknown function (DUF4207)
MKSSDQELINKFNLLDLQTSTLTRQDWNLSHRITTTHSEFLNETQVDYLISKLKNNLESVQKWSKIKIRQDLTRKLDLEKKRLEELKKEYQQSIERQQRQEKVKKAVEEWKVEKEQAIVREKGMRLIERIKTREERELRKNKAQQAFNDWLCKSKDYKSSAGTNVCKKNLWVGNITSAAGTTIAKTNTNNVLSPPGLYNDYELYQRLCPNFIKKYPLLVSTAGKDVDVVAVKDKQIKVTAKRRSFVKAKAK